MRKLTKSVDFYVKKHIIDRIIRDKTMITINGKGKIISDEMLETIANVGLALAALTIVYGFFLMLLLSPFCPIVISVALAFKLKLSFLIIGVTLAVAFSLFFSAGLDKELVNIQEEKELKSLVSQDLGRGKKVSSLTTGHKDNKVGLNADGAYKDKELIFSGF